MAIFISHSPTETEALGEDWGRTAPAGMVLALCGELGAGKTQLVKGLARGLNIPDRVHSPTFALVNVYNGGRLTLFHLDLYRLENREQISAAGLDEFLEPAGVAVIEWAERLLGPQSTAQSLRPTVHRPQVTAESLARGSQGRLSRHVLRWVTIEATNETERRITYEDFGA